MHQGHSKNNIERAITQLFKKGNFEKNKRNLHTATGNRNPKLRIRIYNGLAILPDLL